MSAVSTKLMPASSARWMIRTLSSWSGLPSEPNIIAPSAYSLTEMPVPPRVLRFMNCVLSFPAPTVRPPRTPRQSWLNLGRPEPPSAIMSGMGHIEDEITPFLKARRAALDPAALGLPNGVTRRRVNGLRREEVAQIAGISVDYYTRIEQGRAPAISDAVLDAIARALRLTDHEHTYLRNITAPGRRDAAGACAPAERPEVRPQIQELLDAMTTVPAVVYGPGTDILAWNRLAPLVFAMDFATMAEEEL